MDTPLPNRIPLLCHWRGDNDIADAFFDYYSTFCDVFHIIVHGPREDSPALFSLLDKYNIVISEQYDEPFDENEKIRRLNGLVSRFPDQWVLLVDSDEFVEFPYRSIDECCLHLEHEGANCMAAPMLQRIRRDGSLETNEVIAAPFRELPLCSSNLYQLMGSTGSLNKFPLIKVTPITRIGSGNHHPPSGKHLRSKRIKGATHHFKWKRSAVHRIKYMIEVGWPWADTEAHPYLRYLEQNNYTLPLDGAFLYSRDGMFRRNLLSRHA